MPVIKILTNLKKVPDEFEIRLAVLMAQVMKRPESQIFVAVETEVRMTRGRLKDPLAILDVTSSTDLTAEITEHYTVSLCEFLRKELRLEADAVLINYRSIRAEMIGFNGHILTENHPRLTKEHLICGVFLVLFALFLSRMIRYM